MSTDTLLLFLAASFVIEAALAKARARLAPTGGKT